MIKNPFATNTFDRIWSKHFNHSNKSKKFKFLDAIVFAKQRFLPLYYNVGNKLTNGNFYKINNTETDFKSSTFLIRDIPSYHNLDMDFPDSLKLKSIFQYQGYTTQVSKYESLDDYLRSIYKSNSRSKFKRNIKRLEACFNVTYTMYYGHISDDEYNHVFESFYNLFEKRYTDKGEPCGELDPEIWSYYTELCYQLINEKKASLFVIYCDQKPVGITFSYHIGDILIEALTVFDIDYYRFNIGHTTILKMLSWSFENNIALFDYTQGDFEYKKRWSDSTYDTHYHILYDSKSLKSIVTANIVAAYFNAKRIFRDLKLNKIYHNTMHKLFHRNDDKINNKERYLIEAISNESVNWGALSLIDMEQKGLSNLRRELFDYLYMHPEKAKQIKLYQKDDYKFYAQGSKQILRLVKTNE